MRSPRVVVVAVLAALLATACGARGGAAAQSTPGSTAPSSQPATTPATANNANCPTSGTDVGLTPTSIVLGTVADRTGPVSGLFAGAEQGMDAFAAYMNSTGGLCGRKVSIDFADSATSCSQNQNVTSDLVNKVFAFVGSFSLYDGAGCGATVLQAHPTVPDIHVSLDPTAEVLPNHFDLAPGPPGYATGMFKYYKQKYGSKMENVGTIYPDIPSAAAKQKQMVNAATSEGWKFTYSNAAAATDTNFTNNFQTACGKKHIQVFYTSGENAQNAATMIQDERSIAACKGVVNIIPIAYDSAFIPDYQGKVSDLDGIQGWSEYALFFNKTDAANIPEVKLFQTWFAKTNPGQPLNLYAMYAWADGRLFQQAFENAGSTATRATVMAALRKVKNFTDGELVSPTEPASKTTGNHCYILWQLQDGQFSRMSSPKRGFRCDGAFLPLK
jgi:ABC-type branched-subunit amino acid transport system substrate-binding protein